MAKLGSGLLNGDYSTDPTTVQSSLETGAAGEDKSHEVSDLKPAFKTCVTL